MTAIPVCGDESFDIGNQIGAFMSGLPCPLDDTPDDADDELELKLFGVWSLLMENYVVSEVLAQAKRHYPGASLIADLPTFVPMEFSNAEVKTKVKECLQTMDDMGLELDYPIPLTPLSQDMRDRIAKQYRNPDYLRRCLSIIDTLVTEHDTAAAIPPAFN